MGYNSFDRINNATAAYDSYKTAKNTAALVEMKREEIRQDRIRELGFDPRIDWKARETQLLKDAKSGAPGAYDELVNFYSSLIFVFGGAREMQKAAPVISIWGTYLRLQIKATKDAIKLDTNRRS